MNTGSMAVEQGVSLKRARRDFMHDYLTELLKKTRGNVASAAKIAGINRTELYRILKRHSIKSSIFRVQP